MYSLFIKSVAICLLLCRVSMSGICESVLSTQSGPVPLTSEACTILDNSVRYVSSQIVLNETGNNETPDETPPPEDDTTEEQKPIPETVTDEQLDAGYLDEWFNGSVMVGDSLTAGFSGYVQNERYLKHPCLGDMKIVSASALTLKKALECEQKIRNRELKYRTRYMTICEVVAATEPTRLFINLGVSDVRWYTPEQFIEAYDTLIEIIKAQTPDIEIYIHSIVPMIESYAHSVNVTAEQNIEINEYLKDYCNEKGYGYIEIADPVRDENGYLARDCSASDYRFHLNKKGKEFWVRSLREMARQQYYEGKWCPSNLGK